MNFLKCIVKIVLVIGALELGIIGLFNYDVIGTLAGETDMVMHAMWARVAFVVIGIAGLLSLICILKHCCSCCCSHNKKDKGGHSGGCCR